MCIRDSPSGVEIDSSSVIHFHGQAIVIVDGFDPAAITVVHVEILIIVRELNVITGGELARKGGVNIHSAQALRIVGHMLSLIHISSRLVGSSGAQPPSTLAACLGR